MISTLVQPVVMAGGGGTRLWPLSRAGFPKQFLALGGTDTLFQAAVQRLSGIAGPGIEVALPTVVGNDEHRFLILEQLRELGLPASAALLLEPVGRNTAPAMTLAALQATEGERDAVLVVTPADQTVTDPVAFRSAVTAAIRVAAEGAICILGITPDRPETGYGYVRADSTGSGAARVQQFVEKPDAETAQRYLATGGYYWNSGIFVLRASDWLKALGRFRPDILAAVRKAWNGRTTDSQFVRPDRKAFTDVPSESVDYAVLEHCPGSDIDLRMIPLDAGWNDLGAWDAVWQVAKKDAEGNSVIGDVLLHESRNTHVHAAGRLVAVVGLDDVVVVETADAVLVAHRSRSQDVKKVVSALGEGKRCEHALHRKVHRPWGWYDSIDNGGRFQVKRIMVKPGASLSLQMHHHRAEHWIVVSGTAEVTNGDKVIMLGENESTFIPLGQKHRLANRGKMPLEIIEVQSGSYLGEDDIVRFEDTYGERLSLTPTVQRLRAIVLVLAGVALSGCVHLSNVGPSTSAVEEAAGRPGPDASLIQLVSVDDAVARKLLAQRKQRMFSEALGTAVAASGLIGAGDGIEVNIWEAPPATLFASGVSADLRGATSGSRVVTLPEQIIDRDGFVNVPFAGKIAAAGRSIPDLELEIARRLKGKANQPEVLVRRVRNASSTVTVVGEVVNSVKLPITPIGERLLDALAAAGGVRQPVNKMTVQITRGNDFYSLPLQTVIRDPRQNVPLQAGDVVTAIFQSLSFTALGSTGRNEEINFEAQGISLAQALARAGGLNDARSDARGVFIFRFEPQTALDWPRQPAAATPEGLVPVIYSIDLRNPNSFFVMQSFAINDRDVLYVSNAPAAELQKFLNLILSVAYPVLTGIQLSR